MSSLAGISEDAVLEEPAPSTVVSALNKMYKVIEEGEVVLLTYGFLDLESASDLPKLVEEVFDGFRLRYVDSCGKHLP